MWCGKEEKNRKQPCLRVNENGFISIYGIYLLMIFLCFIILFTQRVSSFQSTVTLEEEYDIYAIRKGYSLYQEFLETKEEIHQDHEEIKHSTVFRDREYTFICSEEKIVVHYEIHDNLTVLQINFDENDGSILSIAYL